jgi:hypothetical protein
MNTETDRDLTTEEQEQLSGLHAKTHSYRPTGHHHPKTKLPMQARSIATSVNKPMMAPRWCVTLALWLTGWFIA